MINLPEICGNEQSVKDLISTREHVFLDQTDIDLSNIDSAFSIALHMHQPLIPAGGHDMRTAHIISNLKHMMDHPHEGDNHNAAVFHWCYKRIGEFIPQLVEEGLSPRIMLDYSGCLLYGLQEMGLHDVIDALSNITNDHRYRRCIEWLGTAWGHPVAPSTPTQDFQLHVSAWQQHFASLFGMEALRRVRGFSPPEMALPNHPDVCFEFVKSLKSSGYEWILVQEHTVENAENGGSILYPHIPHRLVATNSKGESLSIIAIIKTQGSDTKLVAQMQPYYEALSLARTDSREKKLPPLVTQIGDGENGGVMMNEFPGMYMSVIRDASDSRTPAMNVTEYLELIRAAGALEEDFPAVIPIMQKVIWKRMSPGDGPERLTAVIDELHKEDPLFHMDGGSWTNNISWLNGYEGLLGPMEKVSALMAKKVLSEGISTKDPRYRNALFHLLLTQTSCYRYWGQGRWTDYGRELCRRATDILELDFK